MFSFTKQVYFLHHSNCMRGGNEMPDTKVIAANVTAKDLKILEAYFEDHNADIIYFYSGKNTVLGLQHPDYILNNEDNHHQCCDCFCY